MKKKVFCICVCCFVLNIYSQKKEYDIRTLAFYNLENLFDTINNPLINDEASPIMKLRTNKSDIYWDKIDKLAFAISKIGFEKANTTPAILGVCEVENREVLEDLIKSKYLRNDKYQIIHYDSPSLRGIDVALLYQERYFKPIHHEVFDPNIYREGRKIKTRDQLLVSGYLGDDLIHVIVNHWPSRRSGEKKTRPLREKAAYQSTKIIAKIREKEPNAKIVLMGDFNDSPINTSLKKVLNTIGNKQKLTKHQLYNPYEKLYKKGYNTLGFRDNINLFDQIILSKPLVNSTSNTFSTFKLYQAKIFNKSFLITKSGRYKGYPFRSFSYGNYTGGYSDHFPVFVYLIKER